jgi:hypothetical protein
MFGVAFWVWCISGWLGVALNIGIPTGRIGILTIVMQLTSLH